MRKLTDKQIELLIKPANPNTGVDAITREMLEAIDLDNTPTLVRTFRCPTGDVGFLFSDGKAYNRDNFAPRKGSIYFKPSFAGRQVLLGLNASGLPMFSNGIFFSTYYSESMPDA